MTRKFNHWKKLIVTAAWTVALNSSLSAQDVTESERVSSPEGVRFDVENVSIAKRFHREINAKHIFERIAMREIVYIYKDRVEYEAYAITGWIHKLFPYIMKNIEPIYDDESEHNDDSVITNLPDWKITVRKIKYKQNPFLNKKVTSSNNLTSKYFPSSILKVPFTWHNFSNNQTDSLFFWSGIWGTKQYGDKTLEPFVSWALTKEEYMKDEDEE